MQKAISLITMNFYSRPGYSVRLPQPVDGSNPATDWQGLHPVEGGHYCGQPHPTDGYRIAILPLSPPLPNTALKKEDYPYYMSIDRENFQAFHAIRLLEGSSGYTLDKLIELAYDPPSAWFEKLIPVPD